MSRKSEVFVPRSGAAELQRSRGGRGQRQTRSPRLPPTPLRWGPFPHFVGDKAPFVPPSAAQGETCLGEAAPLVLLGGAEGEGPCPAGRQRSRGGLGGNRTRLPTQVGCRRD